MGLVPHITFADNGDDNASRGLGHVCKWVRKPNRCRVCRCKQSSCVVCNLVFKTSRFFPIHLTLAYINVYMVLLHVLGSTWRVGCRVLRFPLSAFVALTTLRRPHRVSVLELLLDVGQIRGVLVKNIWKKLPKNLAGIGICRTFAPAFLPKGLGSTEGRVLWHAYIDREK